jgi:hypothetical protein
MSTLPIALNAACTTTAAALLVPLVAMYPTVAHGRVASRIPGTVGYVALDAALCFGPLLVPLLVLAGAVALRSAWIGERGASRSNWLSVVGWSSAAAAATFVLAAS